MAASRESARALIDALSEFDAEAIRTSEGSYEVTVTLGTNGQETIAVLNALERFATDQARSARITLDGRAYVIQRDPAA